MRMYGEDDEDDEDDDDDDDDEDDDDSFMRLSFISVSYFHGKY